MKAVERILIKMAVIQFVFLLLAQLFLHQLDGIPELKVLAQYEGVVKDKSANTVETIWNGR
jgi:hypothetical protein